MSGLEQEFPQRVVAVNKDATTPEAAEECAALGFENHGLVVRQADGVVVFKQADHTVDVAQAREAIRELVGG